MSSRLAGQPARSQTSLEGLSSVFGSTGFVRGSKRRTYFQRGTEYPRARLLLTHPVLETCCHPLQALQVEQVARAADDLVVPHRDQELLGAVERRDAVDGGADALQHVRVGARRLHQVVLGAKRRASSLNESNSSREL